MAYQTFVRPVLEYASCVWDSNIGKCSSVVEAVQRRAARFIMGEFSWAASPTAMLNSLNIPSLEARRKEARLTMLFKIISGLVDVQPNHLQPLESRCRGHNRGLQLITTRTEQYRGSFFPDVVRAWNALPQSAVSAMSVEVFRRDAVSRLV